MKKSKELRLSDLQLRFTASTYERGKDYYAKGRVLNLSIVSQGTLFVQLSATVKGNDIIPYKQNIRIIWRDDYRAVTITGNCSCPIGYNCKHVVAACLMYQYSLTCTTPNASCLEWLNSLNTPTPQRDSHSEFIAYLLNYGKNPHEFSVELVVTKEKKSGGLNKGRKLSLDTMRYSYSELNYIQHEDQEILKLLSTVSSGIHYLNAPALSRTIGFLALSKLFTTGALR